MKVLLNSQRNERRSSPALAGAAIPSPKAPIFAAGIEEARQVEARQVPPNPLKPWV
jgi:hypothetical protein